jgi:arsenate reductase
MGTLFVCESNAGPSVLAEALVKGRVPRAEVWSAGLRPSHVAPEVRLVLREHGLPTTGLRSKGIEHVPLEEIALVITLSRGMEGLKLPAHVRRLDWPLPDPASYPDDERLEAFRATFDELERRVAGLSPEVFE